MADNAIQVFGIAYSCSNKTKFWKIAAKFWCLQNTVPFWIMVFFAGFAESIWILAKMKTYKKRQKLLVTKKRKLLVYNTV